MKKYKLQKKKYLHYSIELFKIEALKDFADIKRGDVGGFVTSEKNLSQNGDCWIYKGAKVYHYAEISENAKVYPDASVYHFAKISGDVEISGDIDICELVDISGNVKISGDMRDGDCILGGFIKIKQK